MNVASPSSKNVLCGLKDRIRCVTWRSPPLNLRFYSLRSETAFKSGRANAHHFRLECFVQQAVHVGFIELRPCQLVTDML